MGIVSVSQALQCLGGYGYCDEFPLEQYYRDVRIHPIHEGTTGIHGLDLLGRKVVMEDGRALQLYASEVRDAIWHASSYPELEAYADRLARSLERLLAVTEFLLQFRREGKFDRFLADATLYLEFFGLVSVGWQWLLQGIASQEMLQRNPAQTEVAFCRGKLCTMRYFFHYELSKMEGLATRVTEANSPTLDAHEAFFLD